MAAIHIRTDIGCHAIEICSKFSSVYVAIPMPQELQKGLVYGILCALSVWCMPAAIPQQFRIIHLDEFFHRRCVSICDSFYQLIFTRQDTPPEGVPSLITTDAAHKMIDPKQKNSGYP
jgi:hypothetical protein